MAFLPSGPLTLKGGCFCSAIRYEICIPALSERPLVPGALPTSIPPASSITYQPAPSSDAAAEATTTVPNRLPTIEYDHCHSCRRACGSLLQVWIIFELKWVTFKLVPRDEKLGSVGHINSREQQDKMVRYETQDIVKPSKELQAETYIGLYSSDGEAQRTFCTRCGTPVAYHFSGDRGPDWNLGPLIDIAMGTLDQESLDLEGVRPDQHGWWDDGTRWVKDLMYKGTGPLLRHPTGSPATVIEEDKTKVEA